MLKADITENFAIRLLEHFADSYARQLVGGSGVTSPLHVRHVKLWSLDAKRMKAKYPDKRPMEFLRVEHGTPRRGFARRVLRLYYEKKLTAGNINELVKRYWKLAVITLEEDRRLNAMGLRSEIYASPNTRWAKAKIMF
jgi:hypothetical protein